MTLQQPPQISLVQRAWTKRLALTLTPIARQSPLFSVRVPIRPESANPGHLGTQTDCLRYENASGRRYRHPPAPEHMSAAGLKVVRRKPPVARRSGSCGETA